jgi:hypothetical protein
MEQNRGGAGPRSRSLLKLDLRNLVFAPIFGVPPKTAAQKYESAAQKQKKRDNHQEIAKIAHFGMPRGKPVTVGKVWFYTREGCTGPPEGGKAGTGPGPSSDADAGPAGHEDDAQARFIG